MVTLWPLYHRRLSSVDFAIFVLSSVHVFSDILSFVVSVVMSPKRLAPVIGSLAGQCTDCDSLTVGCPAAYGAPKVIFHMELMSDVCLLLCGFDRFRVALQCANDASVWPS